jgi:signal transduction histidine kinase
VPPAHRADVDYVRRARTAGLYSLAFGGFGLFYAAMYTLDGAPSTLAWVTLGGSAWGLTLPVQVRLGVPPHVATSSGVLCLIALQVVQVWFEGPSSWAHAWLVAAPLVGHAIGGSRVGLFSLVAALAALWGLVLARDVPWLPEPAERYMGAGVLFEISSLIVAAYVVGIIPSRAEKKAREELLDAIDALKVEVDGHRATQRALRDTQRDLLEVARQAGMAEVATGVLHNVGNALNSVSVSAHVVRDQAQRADLERRVAQAAARLREAPGEASTVAGYLDALAGRVGAERAATQVELDRVISGVAHVAAVVQAQQHHARSGGLVEEVTAADLVESALRLADPAVQRAGAIVDVAVPAVTVTTEAHQVVQILVNLLRNAADALRETTGPRRILVDGVERDGKLRLRVRDTGAGVPPDVGDRVFQHGFTTKRDGNGFGLHVSALAARAVGGHLQLDDPKPGEGASFSLWLPRERPVPPERTPPTQPEESRGTPVLDVRR